MAALVAMTMLGWRLLLAGHDDPDPAGSVSQGAAATPPAAVTSGSSPSSNPTHIASILADKSSVGAAHDATALPEGADPALPERGIFLTGEAPSSVQDLRATSHWGGVPDGVGYVVWAGEDGQDESTGEVVALSGGDDRTRGGADRLPGVGALTIVDATDAGALTLRDASGGLHHYDTLTASFTD